MSLRPFSLLLIIMALAGFQGCFEATAPGDTTSAEDELSYNYELLHVFYIYQDELESLDYYRSQSSVGTYGATSAMYATLQDPYTNYFTPDEYDEILSYYLTSGSGNALMGIQVIVQDKAADSDPDTLVVKRVIEDSPAEDEGVKVGDKLLKINGQDNTGEDAADLFTRRTTGDAGTVVELEVLRGSEVKTFSITKAYFNVPTVYLDSSNGVPVIQITEFAATSVGDSGTALEFRKALAKVAGKQSVVVDVRGNPGGSVAECLDVSDQFIATGNMITEIYRDYDARTDAGYEDTVENPAKSGDLGEGMYLVALADSGSASCSEIFLAAVKANLGTKIVGTRSYGKGIGQQLFDTYAGGLAVITSLQLRDANGVNYHHEGIAADYEPGDPESELALAVSLAKGHGDTTAVLERKAAGAGLGGLTTEMKERRVTKGPSAWIRGGFRK